MFLRSICWISLLWCARNPNPPECERALLRSGAKLNFRRIFYTFFLRARLFHRHWSKQPEKQQVCSCCVCVCVCMCALFFDLLDAEVEIVQYLETIWKSQHKNPQRLPQTVTKGRKQTNWNQSNKRWWNRALALEGWFPYLTLSFEDFAENGTQEATPFIGVYWIRNERGPNVRRVKI